MAENFFDYETARLRQMTAEQKLRTLDALRRSASRLVEAGVRTRHPDLDPAAVRAEVRRALDHAAS
ncbi:MAG: hypothetical protein ACKVZ0_07845 [Gemmatimonadales bacterium]